jgi:RIO kinase 1
MSVRELFDFVVDPSIMDDDIDDYLEKMQQKIRTRGMQSSAEEEIAEAVVVQSFIPRTLDQVKDFEKDIDRINSGNNTEGIYYQTITGLKEDLSGVRLIPAILENVNDQPSGETEGFFPDSISADQRSRGGLDRDLENIITESEKSSSSASEDEVASETEDNQSSLGENQQVDRRTARKEHKKVVKAEKREARKTKIPKAVKKRKKKVSKEKMRH